ncbi:hypothetical protein DFJ73DRAFT_861613 [Zopfochytrium polystomum]|nr:hypothetical protein DFJ73DRAFT_861613 [Zopfochytrium polystomum]
MDSIRQRFGKISAICSKMVGCYSRVHQRRQSGANLTQIKQNAIALFEMENPKTSWKDFEDVYFILSGSPKWSAGVQNEQRQARLSEVRTRSRSSSMDPNDSSSTSGTSTPCTPPESHPTENRVERNQRATGRPIGAKRAKKNSAGSATDVKREILLHFESLMQQSTAKSMQMANLVSIYREKGRRKEMQRWASMDLDSTTDEHLREIILLNREALLAEFRLQRGEGRSEGRHKHDSSEALFSKASKRRELDEDTE